MSEAPTLSPETQSFFFGLVRDAPERQLQTQEALDGKIVQVFAAAGVVLGLVGTRHVARGWETALLVGAVIAFVVVAVATGYAIWSRKFRVSRQIIQLWERHWMKEPQELEHMLISDAVDAYSHNKTLLIQKSCALKVAVVAAAVEIGLVGTLFIWASFTQSVPHTPVRVSQAAPAAAPAAAVVPLVLRTSL